ncbi:MAG TPA: twin-arginine translocase subunit TatC [Longimicrobiaceae bacterium]
MKYFRINREEMPFLDHLEELRWRLIWSLAAALLGAIIGFFLVVHFDVLGILVDPIEPFLSGDKLAFLDPITPFFITLKLAVIVGLILASPIIIYHIWAFLSPALLPSEKRAIVPSLYMGLILFAAGVVMAYFVVVPMTLRFTMGFQTESLTPVITIDKHLGFMIRLLLAFGLVFELPVVVLILSVLGIVTPEFLAEKRRYAIAAIAILSAVLTPGDVITVTILMMVPLMALYEFSILLSRIVEKRRIAAAATADS